MVDEIEFAETEKEKREEQKGGFNLASIVLLVAIVIAGAIVGFALMRQNQGRPLDGPAPAFGFTTFDGETYKLDDFRGKVVVLNFWASWCTPCAAEAPDLQSAWELYQDKDVVFIGIAYADNGPNSLEFLDRFGITYLNAPDLGTFISDEYHIEGVPETFIIDKDGNVTEFIYAGVTVDGLSKIIDPLLGGS